MRGLNAIWIADGMRLPGCEPKALGWAGKRGKEEQEGTIGGVPRVGRPEDKVGVVSVAPDHRCQVEDEVIVPLWPQVICMLQLGQCLSS